MKKVLIIEDEEISARYLKKMINKIEPDFDIVGPLTTVDEVVSELSRFNDYYIIFSDIRLNSGTVFKAFEKVEPHSAVIFTTAYDEYVLSAFKSMGIDYLLKPIDFDELKSAIEKVEKLGSMYFSNSIPLETKQIVPDNYRKHLLVTRGEDLIPIKTEDISYIKKEEYVRAYLFDGSSYGLSLNLGELESILDPNMFFRINRQYIANINSFQRISTFFNSKLTVTLEGCSDIIVVSKERAGLLKRWLEK